MSIPDPRGVETFVHPPAKPREPASAAPGADGAAAMARRPRLPEAAPRKPVPLRGLREAVVGRLVEPGLERGPTAKPAAALPTALSTGSGPGETR